MLSVVIPCRDPYALVEKARTAYPWADEVVLQGGPGGVALARNNGARKAHGDLLVFTDDDTILELLSEWTPKPEEGFWVGRQFSPECDDPHTMTSCLGLTALATMRLRAAWLASIGPFMAVRRSWFERVQGFRRAPQEDTDFGQRLKKAGAQLGVAPFRVRIQREFRLKNAGMAIANYVAEADLPVADGPAIVLRPRFPLA